ncbi:MAG: GNAT family N-acetyltransferase, partial [Chloroflexi bacterium]|nr:GNAT family N-acetyltransferase [Chloroflexota bacterium]
MTTLYETLSLPRPLADGLILRRATPADTEAIAALNARILAEEEELPQWLKAWTYDLMSGCHPTTTAADFILGEDTHTAQIVSSACLIPQVWLYEDIPFGVGRPELVATDPAYRRRGLMRAIFEALHALSAAQGHLAQGITGIPWFYRQFGYEYALPLGGSRSLKLGDVPALKEAGTEPYQIRPATEADIPILMDLYQRQCAGKLVTAQIDEVRWRYDLTGHSKDSIQHLGVNCVLNQAGSVAGYYTTSTLPWGGQLTIWEVIVAEGVSLRAVLPAVVRALKAQAEAYQANAGSELKP